MLLETSNINQRIYKSCCVNILMMCKTFRKSWLSILILRDGIVLSSVTMAMMMTRIVPLQSHQMNPLSLSSWGDEHLNTIPATESNEFIKSSIEDLVPNPSEFEDECECDVPNCDDSQTTNFSTFSNPLFDDSTASDDESSHEEVIHEMSFKTYSNPLFDLDEEIISSEFNPIHNEDLDSTPKNDRFDTKSCILESLLNCDESIPLGIDNDDSNFEGDTLSLEILLHDDPIPLSDTLDFLYDVRVFLPFFTYPVTSSILLSSRSEDTIFDPGIYHFSSLELGVSHRSETFMKFNIYPNHLNESLIEILSSTCSPIDQ
nr:hypothetical protein [Tanacetum cinerariifolium]